MAHLGADVAAFVDGQLSDAAMRDASTHLLTCDACEKAVRQQRLLKSRMSTVAAPEPPAELLASLAGLAARPPRCDGWWSRLTQTVPFRAGLALASAAVAVVATAYAVGGPDRIGDEVAPPFDRYAADFRAPGTVQSGEVMTAAAMDELDSAGWPCLAMLAGDLQRVSGSYTEAGEVVSLAYTDGRARLNLFEQNGALDRGALDGFSRTSLGGSEVWVREGSPLMVSWDHDGTVYTIVTDADRERIDRAIQELPGMTDDPGPVDRIGDGLTRMTTWLGAA